MVERPAGVDDFVDSSVTHLESINAPSIKRFDAGHSPQFRVSDLSQGLPGGVVMDEAFTSD